jgi:hypothetical protein
MTTCYRNRLLALTLKGMTMLIVRNKNALEGKTE